MRYFPVQTEILKLVEYSLTTEQLDSFKWLLIGELYTRVPMKIWHKEVFEHIEYLMYNEQVELTEDMVLDLEQRMFKARSKHENMCNRIYRSLFSLLKSFEVKRYIKQNWLFIKSSWADPTIKLNLRHDLGDDAVVTAFENAGSIALDMYYSTTGAGQKFILEKYLYRMGLC